jgi:hypothetical protein
MLGKFVKGTTAAISLLNRRAFTILLILLGAAATVYLVPSVILDGNVTKREALGIFLLFLLPYLIVKGVILILLLLLDISINFSAKRTYTYKISTELVKAKVAKLFLDKNINYVKLDNFEFGIEKYFVAVLQKSIFGTKFTYPANYVSAKPFMVVRIYDLKNGSTQLKVLYEEEKDAEIIARFLIASIEAFDNEISQKTPASKFEFNAGAIKIKTDKPETVSPVTISSVELAKQTPKKKEGGLWSGLRRHKK